MKRITRWILLTGAILLSACNLIPTARGTPGGGVPATQPPVVVPSTAVITEVRSTDATMEGEPTLTPVSTEGAIDLAPPALSTAGRLPDPDTVTWQEIASGLEAPLGLTEAGDGSGRLFIVEQGGAIRIWQNSEVLPEPFLDLSGVVDCCGERGLLGLVFHPDFVENGYFYVNYTERIDGTLYTSISRFQVTTDPNRADQGSEVRLLYMVQPYDNHNGGGLAFGPDGYLYIALGDGGSAGDPQGNGQALTTLLGKILRIDVDSADPYAIPADNPYMGSSYLPEIWAYGLRNPWRFSFDMLTGDMYIGDVGQGSWEEIDFLPAGAPGGANFGWDRYEGNHPYEGQPGDGQEYVFPVAEYGHTQGTAVTGGMVYRGSDLPEWNGVYLYGDFSSGLIWGLLRQPDGSWENALLFETGYLISSFGQDANGEVYLVDYSGSVLRLARP